MFPPVVVFYYYDKYSSIWQVNFLCIQALLLIFTCVFAILCLSGPSGDGGIKEVIMSRLFSLENPFMQFLSKICDLLILNVVFIFSCIPLFTIGASLSALNTVALKMVRQEEPYIVKGFFKAFASNFKQSTIVWLLCVVVFVFFRYDYTIASSMQGDVFRIIQLLLLMIILVFAAAFLYVFPIIAHYICTTKQAIRNAFLMSLAHLPYTLLMFVYFAVIGFLLSFSTTTFGFVIGISMICGFSVTAFLCCILFNRIFKKYDPKEETEEPAQTE